MTKRPQSAASVAVKGALYLLMICVFLWGIQIKLSRYTSFSSTSPSVSTQHLVERRSVISTQPVVIHEDDSAMAKAATVELPVSVALHGVAVPAFAFALHQAELSLCIPCRYDLHGPDFMHLPPPTLS